MRLIHNASDEAGIYYEWVGQAGGTGATLNAELRATFTPTDSPTSPNAVKDVRGALQATSSALPTAFSGTVVPIGSPPPFTWTLASGSALTLDEGSPKPPLMRPASNVIGWWFVLLVNGVEYSEILLPFQWMHNYRMEMQYGAGRDDGIVLLSGNRGYWFPHTDSARTLPANTTIRIYQAVV